MMLTPSDPRFLLVEEFSSRPRGLNYALTQSSSAFGPYGRSTRAGGKRN